MVQDNVLSLASRNENNLIEEVPGVYNLPYAYIM